MRRATEGGLNRPYRPRRAGPTEIRFHFKEVGVGTSQFFDAGICSDVPQIVQSAILVILADARKTQEIIGVSVKGSDDNRCVNAAFQKAVYTADLLNH